MDYDADTYEDEEEELLVDDFNNQVQSDNDDVSYKREKPSPTPIYDDMKSKRNVDEGYGDGRRVSLSTGGGKRKRFGGGGEKGTDNCDPDMQEMWDAIAPQDPEDDHGGRQVNSHNHFIDGNGLDSYSRYYREECEDEDVIKMFKMGKKKKTNKKSSAEIAFLVENVMAQLELAAEEDVELNLHDKPAINKLKRLPLLTDVLSKKQLQHEFLDHGILTILKNWLEPLPDGSLPNINIRAAVLKILSDLPIDLEQHDRREQLKRSGIGKVIMFLSKSYEETPSNRKLARELVDQWSRHIFKKSTRFEDMINAEVERTPRSPSIKKRSSNRLRGKESREDDDIDLSEGSKAAESSSSLRASRPEAMSMDFVVRPQSNVDPGYVRARSRHMMQNQKHLKMNKKMEEMKATKKKQLQATKLSVEGRGMVKYL